MTFFIQCCPACARRFEVHLRALGIQVECRFCYSVFSSFDGTEDSGEASDRVDQWAREASLENEHKSEDNAEVVSAQTDAQSLQVSHRPR